MKTLATSLCASLFCLLGGTACNAQVVYSQCSAGDVYNGYNAPPYYWSAVVTRPAGEYGDRDFFQTFGHEFERHLIRQLGHNVDVTCDADASFSTLESRRRNFMSNYQSSTHTMTGWTDGRPVATAESSAVSTARRRGPPAIVVETPDNRRTPTELARENAQRAADRQRAIDQTQRTAALQVRAQQLRQQAAEAAAEQDARDRANRCGRYRDPNSRSACVSPQ
jgi:hypothetical protein